MNTIYLEQYVKSLIKKVFRKKFLYSGDLRKYQLNKINEIIDFAKMNSNFYKSFYSNLDTNIKSFDDIKKLPILKKDIFKKAMQNDEILCKIYNKNDLYSGDTTGSTGVPLRMYFDEDCIKKRAIVQQRLWQNMKIFDYKRFVRIWRDKKISKKEKELMEVGLFLPIAVGDINEPISTAITNKKLQDLLNDILKFNPQIIRGYVSSLYNLASLIEKKNIKFLNLESIITSAEYLPKQIWQYFEKIFNCTVYNLYGCTEASSIAVNKSNSYKMVISEDLYFVEVLDENGNNVKPGEQGLITITDLHSKAMPLIRYQIGDMAIVDESFYKFAREFRYFVSVEGRTNDIFELENGSLIYSHLWFVYFREKNWISKFKVIQNDKSKIHIQLQIIDDKELPNLKKKIENIYPNINFTWEIVDKFDLDIGCKFRSVISHVPNKFNSLNKGA